ncbi:MAG: transposase, partial [Planctomycetes bacterium]|nr:transposase [Planctomycetota bacterium]
MMAAPKPKQNDSGHYEKNGRAAKRGLSRSLANVALGEVLRQIEYKCRWRYVAHLPISRWEPSSKTCSGCLVINDELTLSDRTWQCQSCGAEHHRDINAGINIARAGYQAAISV